MGLLIPKRRIAGVAKNAQLQTALHKRSALDDIASSVFQEGLLTVVLRLRRAAGRIILTIDDGRGAVDTPLGHVRDLDVVLPLSAEAEQIGYEYARRVILRAFRSL